MEYVIIKMDNIDIWGFRHEKGYALFTYTAGRH